MTVAQTRCVAQNAKPPPAANGWGPVTEPSGSLGLCNSKRNSHPRFRTTPSAAQAELCVLSYASIFEIQVAVALRCGVSTIDIQSARRDRTAARPRQLVMWLARHTTLLSLADIGRALARDHTTVMHGIRRVDELLREDAEFAWMAAQLRYELTPREAVA
jgi:hypothetical protein